MKIRFLRSRASDGLNGLCQKLIAAGHRDTKKVLLEGSSYTGLPHHLIINWGSSNRYRIKNSISILNDPTSVANAVDKLKTFQILKDNGMSNNIPRFTTSFEEARRMIEVDFDVVYCRTLTRSSAGNGIVISRTVDELVQAPLYVVKVKSDREIRVHVFEGEVIDFSQKKKISSERREELGIVTLDLDIRSHSNGWVFAREGVSIPDSAKEVAIKAVSSLGLDFGAVDIIISNGIPKVLEVNTSPGLEGTTLESYTNAILRRIDRMVS